MKNYAGDFRKIELNSQHDTNRSLVIIYAMLWFLLWSVAIGFFGFRMMTGWRNDSQLIQAQAGYYQALREQVGRPQIIEHRYNSPDNVK